MDRSPPRSAGESRHGRDKISEVGPRGNGDAHRVAVPRQTRGIPRCRRIPAFWCNRGLPLARHAVRDAAQAQRRPCVRLAGPRPAARCLCGRDFSAI